MIQYKNIYFLKTMFLIVSCFKSRFYYTHVNSYTEKNAQKLLQFWRDWEGRKDQCFVSVYNNRRVYQKREL